MAPINRVQAAKKINRRNNPNNKHYWKNVDKKVRQQRNIKAYFPPAVRKAKIPEEEKFYVGIENHQKDYPEFGISRSV